MTLLGIANWSQNLENLKKFINDKLVRKIL